MSIPRTIEDQEKVLEGIDEGIREVDLAFLTSEKDIIISSN